MPTKNNPFSYSDTNKRYHTYDYYLRHTFGFKCVKIPLDAGFTCPNLDGSRGRGGCTYCTGRFRTDPGLSITEQFDRQVAFLSHKWPGARYIAYFGAHTNTWAPTERLRAVFEEALAHEGTVGLSIATRADALSDETVAYLQELAGRTHLTVELGLQTVHDETARRINRCHSYAEFLEGYEKLRGIPVDIHLINGLPGEDRAAMLETAEAVGALRPHGVKIHLLYVMRGTALADSYEAGEFETLDRETYVEIVCSQLERLPPETVIDRLTGDGDADGLIAPLWSRDKKTVLNAIDRELVRRDSWQGRLL